MVQLENFGDCWNVAAAYWVDDVFVLAKFVNYSLLQIGMDGKLVASLHR